MNDRNPYVFKTSDYGATWTLIASGIPRDMFGYAHCIREDPVRKGLLYLGTENALYVSFDDGNKWMPLQTNLPHAPVTWLTVQERFHDLVLATYGRGFWILDDITPLEQLTRKCSAPLLICFGRAMPTVSAPSLSPGIFLRSQRRPQSAVRRRHQLLPESSPRATCAHHSGRSRPHPSERSRIEAAGLNRIWWDLRYEPT